MLRYHDEEWGVPVHDDRAFFELLVLEGAQAGLSWVTILRKRENYRRAFDGFDSEKIARYGDADVERLLADPGIIRNRLKIASTISNAQAFLAVREEFGSFDAYIWRFVGGTAEAERRAEPRRDPGDNAGVRRHEQGPQEARLPLRRLHHLLRLHAGHRHGQRPRGHVFPVWRLKTVIRRNLPHATLPDGTDFYLFRLS